MQLGFGARGLGLFAGVLALILLPWAVAGDDLARAAMALVATLADRPWLVMALVVALLALDPVLPVPSSIVGVAAGSGLGLAVGWASIMAGLMAGAVLGFWLGRQPGHRAARAVLGADGLQRLAALTGPLGPLGPMVLVLSRPVPVLAEAAVIMAGAARMGWRPFLLAMLPANAVLALVYAGLGAAAAGDVLPALAGAILVPAVGIGLWQARRG